MYVLMQNCILEHADHYTLKENVTFLTVLQDLPASPENTVESLDVPDSANDADSADAAASADVDVAPDAPFSSMIDAATDAAPDNDSDADD